MPLCEELSVLDLLKVHIPSCPGCVQPMPTAVCSGSQADPDLLDILTFAGLLSEEIPALTTQANSDAAPQTFFGISLDSKVDVGVEHLASFLQLQTSAQQQEVDSKKSSVLTPTPLHVGQDHPQLPAVTTLTYPPSPSTRCLTGVSPKHLAPLTPGSQKAVLPTSQQQQLAGKTSFLSPNTPKPSHQELVHGSSPVNTNLELELHPSPSPFFKETRGEALSADNHTSVQVSSKITERQTAIDGEAQLSEANPDFRKSQSKVESGSTKDQEKGSRSSHSHQMKDSDSCPKKEQELHSPENQANSDKVRQGKKDPSINKAKSSPCLSESHHERLGSGSSNVEDKPVRGLSKGLVKDGKPEETRSVQNSSRCSEGKATKTLSKDHTKSDLGSRKGDQSKVVSSYKDKQNKDVSRARRGENKTYDLPFISTDEQENRDNEVSDPVLLFALFMFLNEVVPLTGKRLHK